MKKGDSKYQDREHLPISPAPKYVDNSLFEKEFKGLFYPIAKRRPTSGTRGIDVTPNRNKGYH